MQKFILLFLLCLLSSCTTLLNTNKTKVHIHAPDNTIINYNGDKVKINDGDATIFPKRSKDSLRFSIENDSLSSNFVFKKKLSGNYFFNFYNYGVGFFIDLTNDRRFTYQKNIHFKIDSISNSFVLSNEKTAPFKQHDFFIYNSPLKAIDAFSQPMITLGVEYFYLDNLSISAEYGTVFTKRIGNGQNKDFKIVNDKGRSFRYELKYYNLLSISNNPLVNEYIGLEARFIRYQYNDDIDYIVFNEDISYFVNESYAVYKYLNIINLKYGLNYPIGKHFYLDLYAGIGIRSRTIKNSEKKYDAEFYQSVNDDDHGHFYNFRGSSLEGVEDGAFLNFSLGFKLGVKI